MRRIHSILVLPAVLLVALISGCSTASAPDGPQDDGTLTESRGVHGGEGEGEREGDSSGNMEMIRSKWTAA